MDPDTPSAVSVVCGWCGRPLKASADPTAVASHGICPSCISVLEGTTKHEDPEMNLLPMVEHSTSDLMCRCYETRQLLLALQRRLGADGDVLGRIGQALASVRRQERVIAQLQRRLMSERS